MGLKVFAVLFDNPQAVYQAGATITGHVLLDIDEELKTRGVRIKFEGRAYVHWTETRTESYTDGSGNRRTRTYTVHYSSHQKYFETKVILYGHSQSNEAFYLPPGTKTYPFRFDLPPYLPTSFEGEFGNIRYIARATIDRPWWFDYHTKRGVNILSVKDLNTKPHLMTPMGVADSKTLCCLCCASGPIEAKMSLSRTGFVPGESIPFRIEITNKSNSDLTAVNVELNQHVSFYAEGSSRHSMRNVASMSLGSIAATKSEEFDNVWLRIPPVPPTETELCRIIQITYQLKLIVTPSGPSFSLKVPLSVTIGTIPLRMSSADYTYGTFQSSSKPTAPLLDQAAASAPPVEDYPNQAPPSYAECVFGKVNIRDDEDNEHTTGDVEFTPVYTYYANMKTNPS
ncbi:arrestin domain-containing protein 3-like isoform X1 [Lingula anatina]|uniref:Arrestin domain-containing protein 3-like isoform X1 n=1 Tax=Lingula anatina TaxID=7574 RepID=A0A1S3K4S9_LINAN|nr:arrestin domain-containing protein 3-like isoform X1 [Lingula anatina]|eukprot:XP_013417424.1 arrestin domain-containing protein 3-like isoform X1 [Lingula anatina]